MRAKKAGMLIACPNHEMWAHWSDHIMLTFWGCLIKKTSAKRHCDLGEDFTPMLHRARLHLTWVNLLADIRHNIDTSCDSEFSTCWWVPICPKIDALFVYVVRTYTVKLNICYWVFNSYMWRVLHQFIFHQLLKINFWMYFQFAKHTNVQCKDCLHIQHDIGCTNMLIWAQFVWH